MYNYPYPVPLTPSRPNAEYPDHGDVYGEYSGKSTSDDKRDFGRRVSRSAHRTPKRRITRSRSLSATKTLSRSRSRCRSRSRSRSKSRSRSRSGRRSRSNTRSRSRFGSRRDLRYKEPSFLDAFRVLYLTPSKQKQNGAKYLATKKRQDKVQELLKSDGLGSKRWFFYPRLQTQDTQSEPADVADTRENSDQRVKIDAEFFRKYKRRSKVDSDAPIAKLKRWELILYKKLGFIQAV